MKPWIVGNLILPAHEMIMRRKTFRYWRELQDCQWWRPEKLREHQLTKLRRLVAMAMECTAEYGELARMGRNWRPESLEDLRKLPVMDKQMLSAHREGLTNHGVAGGPIRYDTGGSSGRPLIFYFDKRRQAYDKAARMRTHMWWGMRPGDREAYIWGAPVELSKQDRLKELRDWLTNEMLLSAFDLSQQSVGCFVERLRRFEPRCLFGYPSSISVMCRLAQGAGHDLRSLPVQVVFSTAEVLYDHQREIIGEAFGGVPVVNGYGSREGGFIAHECPEGGMHITSENVIVEFLTGGRSAGPGEDGEIVVTHLDNHAMPFIRYRTGDIGQPSEGTCPCGRGLELMKVLKGRTTDFVIAPDGRWVHGLALIYVVRATAGVDEYQIVQDDVDAVRVRLVVDDGFPADGAECIREGIIERLGQDVRVSVELVDAIEGDPSGKFRYVISHVAREREPRIMGESP